ncbi:uncharacterized protein MEPE_02748 [Melanopsichium pennsylvanicum]|uniref:Uncharacterized protein n=1 Tax=Melanopsichium pennsylvanicum TaxID=63383 RepID=A0AAJ4XKX8_9BASI|nr:uncharacterized protein MEPE_02748 [Melanopsichium pennsylvanicum]
MGSAIIASRTASQLAADIRSLVAGSFDPQDVSWFVERPYSSVVLARLSQMQDWLFCIVFWVLHDAGPARDGPGELRTPLKTAVEAEFPVQLEIDS